MEENHRNDINFFCHLETWHNQHTSKMWLEFILGFIRAFKWEFFFLFVYSFSLYYWHSASIFTYFSGVYILRDARESHLCWYIHTYIYCLADVSLDWQILYICIYTHNSNFEMINDTQWTCKVNISGIILMPQLNLSFLSLTMLTLNLLTSYFFPSFLFCIDICHLFVYVHKNRAFLSSSIQFLGSRIISLMKY